MHRRTLRPGCLNKYLKALPQQRAEPGREAQAVWPQKLSPKAVLSLPPGAPALCPVGSPGPLTLTPSLPSAWPPWPGLLRSPPAASLLQVLPVSSSLTGRDPVLSPKPATPRLPFLGDQGQTLSLAPDDLPFFPPLSSCSLAGPSQTTHLTRSCLLCHPLDLYKPVQPQMPALLQSPAQPLTPTPARPIPTVLSPAPSPLHFQAECRVSLNTEMTGAGLRCHLVIWGRKGPNVLLFSRVVLPQEPEVGSESRIVRSQND